MESSNTAQQNYIPTIAFLGKTGAGKTTLMNALAQEILGKQASSSQLTSETQKITVHDKKKFLGDNNRLVNFVDIPGLSDSSGNDQKILDMTASMKPYCPKIDLFVLCFEKGKFDASI